MPVSRNQAELRTDKRTYTAKDLKRNDTDQYNRISEYGKMMAAFILSLRSNDVILMPDITFLGNGNEEILTNYHNAYRQGVHLKFNRGKVGNTENFSRSTVIKEKDLLELCGNVTQQHERFRDELIRAKEHGIKIIVLCEHGEDIQELTDVLFWTNPRLKEMDWRMVDGHPQKVQKYPHATTGEQLYKSLCTIAERYGVEFRFCTKNKTGEEIVRILKGSDNDG